MTSGRSEPELLAQLRHVNVHRALVAVPVGAPDAVEQLLAREGQAGVVGEEGEQIELAGGQRHDLARPASLPAPHVDLEVADGEHLLGRRALAGPAQDGADAGNELAGRERLDQVVVGTQLQAEDAVHLVVPGRQEQHGNGAAGTDLAADVEPVPCPREPHVEDDDPGVRLLEDLEALLAVDGQQHPVALAPQVEVHQVGDVRVVLDDDNRPVSGAHAPSLPSPAPEMARMCALLTEPSRLPNTRFTACADHDHTAPTAGTGPAEHTCDHRRVLTSGAGSALPACAALGWAAKPIGVPRRIPR